MNQIIIKIKDFCSPVAPSLKKFWPWVKDSLPQQPSQDLKTSDLVMMILCGGMIGILLYLGSFVQDALIQGGITVISGMGLFAIGWVSYGVLGQGIKQGITSIRTIEIPAPKFTFSKFSKKLKLPKLQFIKPTYHPTDVISQIFEQAPVGIAILDQNGKIRICNHTFRELIESELKTKHQFNFYALFEEDDSLSREIPSGETPPKEVRLKNKPDKIFTLYTSSTPTSGNEEKIVYLFDSSEQKKLENQFAQSQKMQAVGQLAGGVAHDFNNLLTAMIGFCDLLLQRHSPSDQSFIDIMQIKQNANRAANLVRQLLAFSRQQTLQPKVLDITETLGETSSLLRRLMGATVELNMVHGHNLGLIKVDQGQFEQVIINLAVNARDAMTQGGTLTIKTSNQSYKRAIKHGHETVPAGFYVLIEVMDTGSGIKPEIMSRIFDPFFSTKPLGSGTGLGLSTVYGIIKQTGGFIWVDSTENTGTKFSIFIPRYGASEYHEGEQALHSPAPAKLTVNESNAEDLTGAGTILFAEDEDAVRIFGARALRNKGYRVIEAQGGEEALSYLHQNTGEEEPPVELLITDVVMPNMDGPTLAREASKLYPGIKIIFISGYTEDAFRESLKEEDIQINFLAKPFSLKDLAGKVKEVLKTPSSLSKAS